MTTIETKVLETVNKEGRVGVLATANKEGKPNLAYFGSPQLRPDGTVVMGLMANRSLANLEENAYAAFLVVAEAPVGFQTPGWRLYLKVKEIDKSGAMLKAVREAIAAHAGEGAAKAIQAGVVFEVTGVRPLVDMG
ncbi:MAG: pyridoxamine 5'-phosphate oxidase family protein [Deltaproteobacteria bacterium]|nr:pyridoxamine 5'-phosphate oxidase family protein [Deltaproteobacteria bacterium]